MANRRLSSIEAWENEGGATPARPATGRVAVRQLPRPPHPGAKAPENTAVGCRARAAADLAAAAATGTANGRRKLQHSANVWSERGELLARLELGRRTRAGGREAGSADRPAPDPFLG